MHIFKSINTYFSVYGIIKKFPLDVASIRGRIFLAAISAGEPTKLFVAPASTKTKTCLSIDSKRSNKYL